MAGTLTVQNIEGPSSGANANKIIIPSGQTFIPSSDQIIQTVQYLRPGAYAAGSISGTGVGSASSAFVDLMSKSITTKAANSKIRVIVGLVGYNSASEIRGGIRLLRDSTVIAGDTYGLYGPAGTMTNFIMDHIDSPSAAAGTALTYTLRGQNAGSDTISFLYQDSGGASNNYITLQEIAQ